MKLFNSNVCSSFFGTQKRDSLHSVNVRVSSLNFLWNNLKKWTPKKSISKKNRKNRIIIIINFFLNWTNKVSFDRIRFVCYFEILNLSSTVVISYNYYYYRVAKILLHGIYIILYIRRLWNGNTQQKKKTVWYNKHAWRRNSVRRYLPKLNLYLYKNEQNQQ